MSMITEALKKLLPAESIGEVEKAVQQMVAEARSELEGQFNKKLSEAYEQVTQEVEESERVAYEGYQQAWAIIDDMMHRMETMQEEHAAQMEEGFGEAYQMLKAEQAKKNDADIEIYNEFNDKLKQMNQFYVEKIDAFMQLQNAEIYEAARRDVLNDPRVVEHRVALERIAETVATYMSEDDFAGATSSRLEEAIDSIKELKGHIQILETRNTRLNTQNTRLNEQVKEAKGLLTESAKTERKERTKIAENVRSGRGQRVVGEQVIAEYHNPQAKKNDDAQTLIENDETLNDMLVLAGLKTSD